MTLTVPNQAEAILLSNLLNVSAPQDLVVKLYNSDTTPAETDTVATYTEIYGGGYADVTLVPGDWVITPGTPTLAAHPEITFAFTGSVGNIYGYYVVQAISGDLVWAERFTNGPFNIQNNGDEIRITPNITLE